jgi:HK97 family phage major capsid protein
MATVIEQREAASAAWKGVNDWLDGKDASALQGEELEQFEKMYADAKALDDAWGVADKTTTARERLSHYAEVATGKGMTFQPIGELARPQSMGQQFVKSDAYSNLVKSGTLASGDSRFESARVPMEGAKAAGDLIHTESGGPATSLVLPQYLPGTIGLPQQELTLRDLFASGSTNSDTISYARQTSFDNAAAPVAQATTVAGGLKPQSSIGWTRQTSPVETIATWMVTTRQALADAGQIQSLIDNQGRLMIQLAEEDQLLNGDGTSPNLEGILEVTGIQTLDLTGEDNLDGIRTAIRLVRTGISRAVPDGIVLNPIDSEMVDLLKDGNQAYRGGNPIGNFNFGQTIWRLPRVESSAMPEGTALVGAFRAGATVLQRQPITVYTADQHADFFVRNLIVILFEERLGFPVFWPSAFVEVTLGDWPTAPLSGG